MSVKKSWPNGQAPYLNPDGSLVAIKVTPAGKKLNGIITMPMGKDPVTKWDRRSNKGGSK